MPRAKQRSTAAVKETSVKRSGGSQSVAILAQAITAQVDCSSTVCMCRSFFFGLLFNVFAFFLCSFSHVSDPSPVMHGRLGPSNAGRSVVDCILREWEYLFRACGCDVTLNWKCHCFLSLPPRHRRGSSADLAEWDYLNRDCGCDASLNGKVPPFSFVAIETPT